MEHQNTKTLSFLQSLHLHSYVNTNLQPEQTPIYQTTQLPYDFYLSLELKGGARLIQFYQFIASLHQAIVDVKHYQILPTSCNFLQKLMRTESNDCKKVRIYMKYFNFTLHDWKQLKKNRGGMVSQEEIIYIMKILLQIAAEYKRIYNQHTKVFQSKNIHITNSRKITLYPTLFPVKYNQQEGLYTQRQFESVQKKYAKVSKQLIVGTNSSQSTLESSRAYQSMFQNCLDNDLIDIFLIVLQILTFKTKEYFFSSKHKMMKWDQVRQILKNKQYVGHLQPEFLQILQKIPENKTMTCQNLLEIINQVIDPQNDIFCLRKLSEQKDLQQKYQKIQEEMHNERRKKLRKTICLSHIGTIKKCNSAE